MTRDSGGDYPCDELDNIVYACTKLSHDDQLLPLNKMLDKLVSGDNDDDNVTNNESPGQLNLYFSVLSLGHGSSTVSYDYLQSVTTGTSC